MTFSIGFIENSDLELENHERLAEITIGSFSERFIVPIDFWSTAEYEAQWTAAVVRCVAGAPKSRLLTSVQNPANADFFFCWEMYRDGDAVHCQNRLLFLDQLSRPFDFSNPHDEIPDRKTLTEENEPVSEWTTSLAELSRFLAAQCHP